MLAPFVGIGRQYWLLIAIVRQKHFFERSLCRSTRSNKSFPAIPYTLTNTGSTDYSAKARLETIDHCLRHSHVDKPPSLSRWTLFSSTDKILLQSSISLFLLTIIKIDNKNRFFIKSYNLIIISLGNSIVIYV